MDNFKKLIFTVFICIFFLCPQKSYAGTASNVADKGINGIAKATYYITKYTLKAGWFVVKKTALGVKVVSKSIFKGTKDAFGSAPKAKTVAPVNKKPDSVYNQPSIHELYTLPPVPKIN